MRDDGRRRYASLPRSSQRIRSEIDEEIGFDIEMRARELAASGMTLEAAREQAAHEFGDIDATRRYCESLDADSERVAGRSGSPSYTMISARRGGVCDKLRSSRSSSS